LTAGNVVGQHRQHVASDRGECIGVVD
jgi:hypothetical protein